MATYCYKKCAHISKLTAQLSLGLIEEKANVWHIRKSHTIAFIVPINVCIESSQNISETVHFYEILIATGTCIIYIM